MPASLKLELPRTHAKGAIARITGGLEKQRFFFGILYEFSGLKLFTCNNIMVSPSGCSPFLFLDKVCRIHRFHS